MCGGSWEFEPRAGRRTTTRKGDGAGRAAESLGRLKRAMSASDEDGAIRSLVEAMAAGAAVADVKRTLVVEMAEDGSEPHSLLYTAAAFGLADAVGPEAARYPLCAAAVQIARQPQDSLVAQAVESASHTGAPHALAESLAAGDAKRAVQAAAGTVLGGGAPSDVAAELVRWGCSPRVIDSPPGYVTHLPLQLASAVELFPLAATPRERALLVGHLVYSQVELAGSYRWRDVPMGAPAGGDPDSAIAALPDAVRGGDLAAVRALLMAAKAKPRFVHEVGRVLVRSGLEANGPLSHRFTLAEAAYRLASSVDPAAAHQILEAAALSIANGYQGPKRLPHVRELPLPMPGSPDYGGRLLVGITSGNRTEAHAALRGFSENGASPRQIALAFMAATGHFDAQNLHSDHAFIVLNCAWSAILDGFFAADAGPLFVELANRLCQGPMDHELILAVEEAEQEALKSA